MSHQTNTYSPNMPKWRQRGRQTSAE